jgi:hypothetical protein
VLSLPQKPVHTTNAPTKSFRLQSHAERVEACRELIGTHKSENEALEERKPGIAFMYEIPASAGMTGLIFDSIEPVSQPANPAQKSSRPPSRDLIGSTIRSLNHLKNKSYTLPPRMRFLPSQE